MGARFSNSAEESPQQNSRSAPQSLCNLRHRLPSKPLKEPMFFHCPHCHSPCFDGNLARALTCQCGQTVKRMESGDICTLESIPEVATFEDTFRVRLQLPTSALPPLTSLTLGVFQESVPRRFQTAGGIAWDMLLNEVLLFFFAQKERCLGVNDLLEVCGVRLKVTGAVPSYGCTVQTTVVQCYETFSCLGVRRVLIEAMHPSSLSEAHFQSVILPYFRQQPFLHIHVSQYFNVNGLHFLVVAADPTDGLITSETEFYFDRRGIRPLQILQIEYSRDNLPQGLVGSSASALETLLKNQIVTPFLEGRFRVAYPGLQLDICRVKVKVGRSSPSFGFTHPSTEIRLSEVSSILPAPPERLVIRAGNTDLLLQAQADSSAMVAQFMQLLQAQISLPETGENALETLPKHRITVVPKGEDSSKCMICISEFQAGEEATTLPCFHMFHSSCIGDWLKCSQICPICKTNVQQFLQG